MATIITVHGTYAHLADLPGDAGAGNREAYWWQPGSAFDKHLRQLVRSDGGEIVFEKFEWSGENSEHERRKAASRLLEIFKELEAKSEPYCVIGHSHGGSIIAAALMESVARKVDLVHLRRWMSVGTPFVEMRKERFLFSRLPLILKAIFIASLMLLFMFGFYIVGEFINGRKLLSDTSQFSRLAISAGLMALPFVLFYLFAKFLDSRKLWFYRRDTMRDARARYASRWLSLCHESDEAVRGLGSLRSVKLNIFDRAFAVSAISLASVFVLPLIYLYVVFSPILMNRLTDYLSGDVYQISDFAKVEQSYKGDRRKIRDLRGQIQEMDSQIEKSVLDTGRAPDLRAKRGALRSEIRAARKELRASHPDITQTDRAARFKRRFLEIDGKACPGNRLCYGGRDVGLNSGLLFHLLTDESASWFVDEEVRHSAVGRFFSYALPVVLVPLVFGLFAVAMVLLVQLLAGYFSFYASRKLDALTWSQVRRSALGNDTETEVAVSARRRPSWIGTARPFLPGDLALPITEHSNSAMIASLGKIRGAISDLAFSEGKEGKTATVLTYLNWQELIHTSYFEVAEFRKLLALAIGEVNGFTPTPALLEDAQYHVIEDWLRSLQPTADAETAGLPFAGEGTDSPGTWAP